MSGTSLDGVDLAACIFQYDREKWTFEITAAETIPYPGWWKSRLIRLQDDNALEFSRTHTEYGSYLGALARDFIRRHGFKADLVASHGHTVFHQPERSLTVQVGDGAAIMAMTGIPVIYDFRSLDVALGGQGAPLVPAGDQMLFGEYVCCLNIGGFANISFDDEHGNRKAYDVCPANIVLNTLAQQAGFAFDEDGLLAAAGRISAGLLNELDGLDYYARAFPKSLGREWVDTYFIPILEKYDLSIQDKLRTITGHVAGNIVRAIEENTQTGKVLVTGGGAKNTFLTDLIKAGSSREIIIPEETIVDYKEALIFAFLGLLRWLNKINVYGSVTGASRDSSSGAIIH